MDNDDNSKKMLIILKRFNLSQISQKNLLSITHNEQNFKNFCNSYSKLNRYSNQVRKEFLLSLSYNIQFSVRNDLNLNNEKNIAENISTARSTLDHLETLGSVSKFIDEKSSITKILNLPSTDGVGTIKNIAFNFFDYSNISNAFNVLETAKNNGHVELNSIILSEKKKDKRLFVAYINELNQEENSFVHKYFNKNQSLSQEEVLSKQNEILNDLLIFQKLYSRISSDNQSILFFADTNDLLNMTTTVSDALSIDKNKILNEKDHQFTPDVFKFYHLRFGSEILYKVYENYLGETDFYERLISNQQKFEQEISILYFNQTNKVINQKTFLSIDNQLIKSTFQQSHDHLDLLKERLASDYDSDFTQIEKISLLQSKINLAIHNLKLFDYNNKSKNYKDLITLSNSLLSGSFKFHIPEQLKYFFCENTGVNLNNKTKHLQFYALMNEISNDIQNLTINKSNITKNEDNYKLLILAKSQFEVFKPTGKFDLLATNIINKTNNIEQFKFSPILNLSKPLVSTFLNKNNAPTENDISGVFSNFTKTYQAFELDKILTSLKLLDISSNTLSILKDINLHKKIYNPIDNILKDIERNNSFLSKQSYINSNIHILKKNYEDKSIKKSNSVTTDGLKDFIKKYYNGSINNEIADYIKKNNKP